MEVYGFVVSASEILRLGCKEGILFTLFNPPMDLRFCLLAHDKFIGDWKRVCVNGCYKFTFLKPGILETISGGKHALLKTTLSSEFQKIDSSQLSNFFISDELTNIISKPAFHNFSVESSSSLISYQGVITEVVDRNNGIYELDHKVTLYITFNISSLHFNNFEEGSEVFVSNAHFINNCEDKDTLVCCGLSSVRNIVQHEPQDERSVPISENFCLKNCLNIHDLLWFGRLILRVEAKFTSSPSQELFKVERDTVLFGNILDFFLSFKGEFSSRKHCGLADEYLSSPHECAPFSESRLPITYDVPYLVDVIDEALSNTCFIDISRNWKISVSKAENMVLIGMLNMSENGTFYLADETGKLPVTISPICLDCSPEKSILTQLENTNMIFIVGFLDYEVIVENIYCKDMENQCFQSIRTSCCQISILDSFCKLKKELSFNFNPILNEKVTQDNVFYEPQCDTTEIKLDLNQNESSDFVSFLVLSKLWSNMSTNPVCTKAIVLFQPERADCVNDKNVENEIVEDSFNFYETEDDLEFAYLINSLNSLCLEVKPRLGQLCFESEILCRDLFPKNIYSVNIKSLHIHEEHSKNGFLYAKVLPDANIQPSTNCLEHHQLALDSVIHCSVKEIILTKRVPQSCFVSGVLIDKLYNISKTYNGKLKDTQKVSLCMILKDKYSQDTIPVYLPPVPTTTVGLLPGVHLKLYGFVYTCSQSGSFYLKASNAFGFEIEENYSSAIDTFSSCFVVKILSACVFSICAACSRKFKESCFCLNGSQVHIKANVIIDNGRKQSTVFCHDETARKILALQEKDWNCLVTYIEQNKKTLMFSDKWNTAQIRFMPVMNQIFFYFCASKSICRPLHLECIEIFNPISSRTDISTVWCRKAVDSSSTELLTEYYQKLKKSKLKESCCGKL